MSPKPWKCVPSCEGIREPSFGLICRVLCSDHPHPPHAASISAGWQYPKGKAVTREEIDTAASVMIEELKANKAARRKAQLAEAAPGAVGGGAVVAAEGKRRFW